MGQPPLSTPTQARTYNGAVQCQGQYNGWSRYNLNGAELFKAYLYLAAKLF